MGFASSSPAGLRLETRFKIDKKKMNFIFLAAKKILLTKKRKRACPRENRNLVFSGRFAATLGRCRLVTAAANCSVFFPSPEFDRVGRRRNFSRLQSARLSARGDQRMQARHTTITTRQANCIAKFQ
jgi:hypothetical protein